MKTLISDKQSFHIRLSPSEAEYLVKVLADFKKKNLPVHNQMKRFCTTLKLQLKRLQKMSQGGRVID